MFFKITGWVGIGLSAVGFLGFLLIVAGQGYADMVDILGVFVFAVLLSTSIGCVKK